MLQGQPKGLYALALANTGERFGYYTMLAIFTLFLQAKFGYTAAQTTTIYASFLALWKDGYLGYHHHVCRLSFISHPNRCRLGKNHDVRLASANRLRYRII